jgi:His-Xaa-Ser system protein HxsD
MASDNHQMRIAASTAVVTVDTGIYSVSAIGRAAHRLTGGCSVFLNRPEAEGEILPGQKVEISLRLRDGEQNSQLLGRAAEDFMNLLLDETLREEIGRETEPVRNLILAHALSGSDVLQAAFAEADPREDPLRIAEADTFRTRMD